jgi:3'-phosphoadenosine 5'-phosphosulfate sulfotransferase (PAPS reductase)/FAD synthetase
MKTISWFSAGVSSAVATKLMINDIDQIIYTHIDDQHQDTMRFVRDCEQWFGKPIVIIQSPYKNVENACFSSGGRGYINGPTGAACTKFLKKRVRKLWEMEQVEPLRYIWGMDSEEKDRFSRLFLTMPTQEHIAPLIEKNIPKIQAHEILKASGIKRPEMYDLGYNNNNCVGCVKGGMGYWNHIRVDFPEVFQARADMERKIHATCIKGIYLDELDPERGINTKPIVDDCGLFCGSMRL